MSWRLFRAAPLFKHGRCDALQFFDLLCGARVRNQFQAVAIRVEKVNRLENAVIRWPENVNAFRLDVLLCRFECGEICDFKRYMLHPFRCVFALGAAVDCTRPSSDLRVKYR